MHLIVPFAAPLAEAGRAALASLRLPQLGALVAAWREVSRDVGDELSFSPPHERALAHELGFSGGDGRLPWAAWCAAADGITPGRVAWGQLTPAHWHLGTDQVSLIDPDALALDDAASRTLFDAVRGLFVSEGIAMHYAAPLRWYIVHESLATLRTASLDRVIGRNVDRWLAGNSGDDPGARLLRRLQNEVQMLLYTHPLNDERQARGLLAVNSFWLAGCGVAQVPAAPAPAVDARLRAPALGDDWAAWSQAWETLDGGPIAALRARRGAAARLTLCGERSSVTLEPAAGVLQRLRSFVARPAPAVLLETL